MQIGSDTSGFMGFGPRILGSDLRFCTEMISGLVGISLSVLMSKVTHGAEYVSPELSWGGILPRRFGASDMTRPLMR